MKSDILTDQGAADHNLHWLLLLVSLAHSLAHSLVSVVFFTAFTGLFMVFTGLFTGFRTLWTGFSGLSLVLGHY